MIKASARRRLFAESVAPSFPPGSNRGRVSVRSVEGRGLGKQYWGQIYVTVDRRGRLAVVNAVPESDVETAVAIIGGEDVTGGEDVD